jgi:hypothetical protein
MESAELSQQVEAALALASRQRFGAPPGRTPSVLHGLYLATGAEPRLRTRVAAALGRVWAYANDAARGAPFAEEAVELAAGLDDPALLADALDARLTTCWGPDDLDVRLETSVRLLDVVAHLPDPDLRLRAYLWRLTTGLEQLDLAAVRRQLAALDLLADETRDDRIRFFACSRRAMFALTEADPNGAEALIEEAAYAGAAAEVSDTEAVIHTLHAELARQRKNPTALAREAASFEGYGAGQGIASILAEGAVLWLESGDTERAGRLVDQLAAGLDDLPRDVDWLLVVTKVCEAAVGSGRTEVAAQCARLLEPYAGRAVLNSGAVAFAGVVDDYLDLATGDPVHATRARVAYSRLGADWWAHRRGTPHPHAPAAARVLHLHPTEHAGPASLWCVGREGATRIVPSAHGMQYLRLLLERPGIDVPALDLSAAGHGTPAVADSDAGPIVDREALAAYRRRLSQIEDELAEADAAGDPEVSQRLTGERGALLNEIGAATGRRGARRAGAQSERARVAVRKAIASALARLEQHDPEVAHELRSTVRTGSTCCYQPDPFRPVVWRLVRSGPHDSPLAGHTE